MQPLFFNGPVQNGLFAFHTRPGKAVGIRLASALNTILGSRSTPHLWNTSTLTADLRFRNLPERRHTCRASFEAAQIATKYPSGKLPAAGTVTDCDAEVTELALKMIEHRLRAGTLLMSRERVHLCKECDHLTGWHSHCCKMCGSTVTRVQTDTHLVAHRLAGHAVLSRSDIHASHRRYPQHLHNMVSSGPPRLLLSRTRDYGIGLAPLGLPGLVVDPRVALHITVIAAARRFPCTTAVMTISENAAHHIAAYGQLFRKHESTRVIYALHGHVPYDQLGQLRHVYAAYGADAAMRDSFETWFLPLIALKQKQAIQPEQLPAFFKHYVRAAMARPDNPEESVVASLQQAVAAGDTSWLMDRRRLANAIVLAGQVPENAHRY